MNNEFALFFGLALVVGAASAFLQHRAYSRAVNRLVQQYRGTTAALVSGRHKGKLRGAVVLLVVDERERRVVAAEAMRGMTVLARFRPMPDLLGPVDGAAGRTRSRALASAVSDAATQFATLRRQAAASAATATATAR